MVDFRNANGPDKLRSAVASLAEHNVPISAAVAAAVTELDRVRSIKPAEVTPQNLSDLYSDPKAKPADLIILAATVSTMGSRRESWGGALRGAGAAGLRAIAEEVGDIVEALRPAAEGHLAIIRWYAEEGSPDVSALVREHRTDDAQKAATAPLAYADWQALVKMRRDLSGRTDLWTRSGVWANPEHVATEMAYKKQLVGLDWITAAVRAGGQLWWPTIEQAAAVTVRVSEAEDAAQLEAWAADQLVKHSAL